MPECMFGICWFWKLMILVGSIMTIYFGYKLIQDIRRAWDIHRTFKENNVSHKNKKNEGGKNESKI